MSAITACGDSSRTAWLMERARRARGNRSGLGKAEPNGTVSGSFSEPSTENTSSLTSTALVCAWRALMPGSDSGRWASSRTK
ncbi:hypothetical protein D3C78_1345180 [compost metagenome]